MSRYGPQPARVLLRKRGYSLKGLAEEIGVPEGHFRKVINGHTRPRPEILAELPRIVGIPATRLFSELMLAKDYDPSKNPWVILS